VIKGHLVTHDQKVTTGVNKHFLDVMGMRSHAVRPAGKDYYVLNGNKFWITNGPICNTLVVYARTDLSSTGGNSISAFILDTKTEGFS
jgi:isovaleryl-CoA dehydrogenase